MKYKTVIKLAAVIALLAILYGIGLVFIAETLKPLNPRKDGNNGRTEHQHTVNVYASVKNIRGYLQ